MTPRAAFSQPKPSLSGMVFDSLKPLASVTVNMRKRAVADPVQMTKTKENGSFQLNKPNTGQYILVFTCTGYVEKQIPVYITSAGGDLHLDTVRLTPATSVMKQVVVTGQRPLIEQSDDKTVFNVEDDPNARSETAIEILRRTPFVMVDGDDNIKVNGKSNFKVLLNGRETAMFARNVKEALRGFPGAMISKIEVITSPSAKYDGEGVGGLINIITKKRLLGYNGSVSFFNRFGDQITFGAINGNAKFGKMGVSVSMSTGFSRPVTQHSISTTIPSTSNIYSTRIMDGLQVPQSDWNYGNAELSWELDTLNTISIYSTIYHSSNRTTTDQTITTSFTSPPPSVSLYQMDNQSHNPGVSVGADYIKHFKKQKEREFSLRFLGQFGKNESSINSFQNGVGMDRYVTNNSNAKNNEFTIQLDNSIPVNKKGTFDGGTKVIMRRASSDFENFLKYNQASDYQLNPYNSDNFNYNQNVVGLYGMYTIRLKTVSYRFGARVEYTSVDGNFISSKTRVENSYATFLPNIQLTERVSKTITLVFGYTKRLQRPYIWDLNPFVNNNDSLDISSGNPSLGPQTVHALNAQVRLQKGRTFAGVNLEGGYSGNKILQYAAFDPQTGITRTTSLNIGREFRSGFNFNVYTRITDKWALSSNGSISYARVVNKFNHLQSNSGFGNNFNFNITYNFTNKFNVSSYLGLWKDPQSIQTTYPFMLWNNIAANYKVFKNKINISIRAVNYFEKTHDYKTVTKDQNFYKTNVYTQMRRSAVIALTWNFGKLKESVSKKKGVNNDDLLNKPSDSKTN